MKNQGIPQESEKPRIKVALILGSFYPEITGVVTSSCRYAPLLARENIALQVETVRTEANATAPSSLEGITIRRHPLPVETRADNKNYTYHALLKEAIACWNKNGDWPHVVVLFGTNRLLIPLLAQLRYRKTPTVFFCTNYPTLYNGWLPRLKQRIGTSIVGHLFQGSFVRTEVMGECCRSLGIPGDQMLILPFGVDGAQFRPPHHADEKESLRAQLGLPAAVPILLFVGAVVERKGVDLLLEAWKEVIAKEPDAVLVIAGPYGDRATLRTPEEEHDHQQFNLRIKTLLKEMPRPEAVRMVGSVSNPEAYYRCSDLFILPSLEEGLGGVVLEAMASELPCLLTPFLGFAEKEFGRDRHEHYKISFKPSEMAEAILFLLCHPDKRKEIGANARALVLRELSLESVVGKMAHAYHRLASGQPMIG